MSAYVDEVLDLFIEDFTDQEIDTSGAYGAQSPDLVQVYVSRLLGRDWHFPYGFAAHLWADDRGVMAAAGFERIERDAPLQRGDVLVYDAVNGYGTVGIFTAPAVGYLGVYMFTQNPGPARIIGIEIDGAQNRMLGAWRFTYGAECIALAGTYADKLQTKRDHRVIESMKANEWAAGLTCPPGDLTPYRDWSATTPAEPLAGHWMKAVSEGKGKARVEVLGDSTYREDWPADWKDRLKKAGDPSMRPGDVAVFEPSASDFGHVEIAQGRHYQHRPRGHGKTALLARLKALFGGGKATKSTPTDE